MCSFPLKKDSLVLGNSYKKATHCLQSLERRLKVKPDFSRTYHEFMLEYETQVKCSETLLETRPNIALNAVLCESKSEALSEFKRFSNYSRLIRSVAYVLRFIQSCQRQYPKTNYLTQDELEDALTVVIRRCQYLSFPEYVLLLNKKSLPQKSALLKFNVYLDDKNIMRVGGRLDNSEFLYNKKNILV